MFSLLLFSFLATFRQPWSYPLILCFVERLLRFFKSGWGGWMIAANGIRSCFNGLFSRTIEKCLEFALLPIILLSQPLRPSVLIPLCWPLLHVLITVVGDRIARSIEVVESSPFWSYVCNDTSCYSWPIVSWRTMMVHDYVSLYCSLE